MARDLKPEQKRFARDAIVELFNARGGNQTKVAEELGISQPSLSKIVKGIGWPGYDTAAQAARLLHLQVEPMLRGERIPMRSVRDLPGYAEVRAQLEDRYLPEVLDAATRALDVLPVAGISPGNFTDAARLAQEHMEVSRTPATGAAKRGIAAVAEIQKQPSVTKKRRAKGE